MSKKPAELSADLVAVKGTAKPAADMPGRLAAPAPERAAPANGAGQGDTKSREALMPLNFRIGAAFRREFKTYAATHDLKLNELLRLAFESYRKTQGD